MGGDNVWRNKRESSREIHVPVHADCGIIWLGERLFRLFLGKMVQYCIAACCSNTRSDGISLFKFPSDPVLREKWTREVKRMRDRWSGPTKHSVLCEKHFTAESFEPDSAIASSMGLAKRKRLRPNAIPTIFERRRPPLPSTSEVGTEPSCSGVHLQSRKRAAKTTTPGASDSSSSGVKEESRFTQCFDTLFVDFIKRIFGYSHSCGNQPVWGWH